MEIEICGQKYTEADVPAAYAKDAIAVQDACNLSGVIISMNGIMRLLGEHPRQCGTSWKNHHPVIVLFLNKCNSLCTGDIGDVGAFSKAYDLCRSAIEIGDKA